MSRKQDPAATVITFFATAPLDEAERVLDTCRNVIKQRRTPTTRRRKAVAVPIKSAGTSGE